MGFCGRRLVALALPLLHLRPAEACTHARPGGAVAFFGGAHQVGVLEEHDLRRPGQHRVPQLLGVAIDVAVVVDVDPAAAVAPRGDVVEVADDHVALVLLQVLVGDDGIAGFGAGVDAVEHLRLLVEVVAVGLEVLVPVGELDDHFHFGVGGTRGRQHQVARDLVHELETEVGPAQISLGGDVGVALGVVEEEIVEHDFVEMARGEFGNLFHVVALFRIGVAHRHELAFAVIAFIRAGGVSGTDIRDASRHLNAVRGEEGFHRLQHRLVGDGPAAIGLDIDLVHGHLRGELFPRALEECGVLHPFHHEDGDVDGNLELVVGRRRSAAHGNGGA